MTDIADARTPVQPQGVPRLPMLKAITSLRFFAALHVALYHLVRPFTLWGILTPVLQVGYIGVSFFFFLSGYILTYSHAAEFESGKGSLSRFWFARFARIYPVYIVSLACAGYVNRAQFHDHKHILAYIADIFLVQTWSVRMAPFFHTTAWSLSVEVFFYLVFPFVFLWLRPRSAGRAVLWIGLFWVLAMAVPLFCVLRYPLASWKFDLDLAGIPGADLAYRARRLPLILVPQFLAGISLGWLFLRFKPRASLSIPLTLAGAGGIALALIFSDHLPAMMLHNGLLIPFYALLILGMSYPNWLSRLFSAKWLVLLGEASFSLYLIHFMFGSWVWQIWGTDSSITSLAWKLPAVIGISVGLYLSIERPGRRILLQWWTRRQNAAV